MKPHWAAMFDASASQLGWIMTLVIVSLGIFTFFAGSWHTVLGSRGSILVGTALLVVAMLVVIGAPGIWAIYVFAFLNGAASCFVYAPALTTVQHWYPHRRGLATGVVNLVFGLAAAVVSPLLALMLDRLGYTTTGWVLIALLIATNAAAALMTEVPARSRLTPAQKVAHGHLLARTAESPTTRPAEDVKPRDAVRTRHFWFLWLTWCLMGRQVFPW